MIFRSTILALLISLFGACGTEGLDNSGSKQHVPVDGPVVLDCGTSSEKKIVYHGHFWDSNVNLPQAWYESWVKPRADAGSTYWITDGYGGAHAILGGWINQFGRLYPYCQMTPSSVISDDGAYPDEVHHWSCWWDGTHIRVAKNGVIGGILPFSGPRTSPPLQGGGGGFLSICGSNHNNFSGRISQVRAFEGSIPNVGNAAFSPQSVFTGDWWTGLNSYITANFLVDYGDPDAEIYQDISPVGFNGGTAGASPRWHPGIPWNSSLGFPYGNINQRLTAPLPQPVIDTDFPHGDYPRVSPTVPSPTPPATPPDAVVFDSFSRRDSTWAFDNNPTLGMTESGLVGYLTWNVGKFANYGQVDTLKNFGIVDGRAVFLGALPGIAWVNVPGMSDGTVSVDRRIGAWNSGWQWTGLTFRTTDSGNFWYAWLGANNQVNVGYALNGSVAWATTVSWAGLDTCATLKVAAYGDNIKVYGCNTLLLDLTNSTHQTAIGWGLSHHGDASRKVTSIVRYDNFYLRQ
jgi:hypothetical protein